MRYREFVEYVKTESEDVVEHLVFDYSKHLILLNGEGMKGVALQVDNVALSNPIARKLTWELTVVPLIKEKGLGRIALIAAGPMLVGDEEPEGAAVLVHVADAERTERWLGVVERDVNLNPSVKEWQGPSLDAGIEDFEILERALR